MKKLIIDVATGQKQEVDLTEEEIAERSSYVAAEESAKLAQETAKASAIAKLQELGLTVEEVKAAFGLEAE